MDSAILSIVVFLPLLGALLCLVAGKAAKHVALVVSLVTFVVSLHLCFHFVSEKAGFQFDLSLPWVQSLGISYHVGIDGLSLWLVLLTTFTGPLAILCSYRAITSRQAFYYAMLLLTEVGLVGVFIALDLFLFYVFWELTLIPMYFLIGIYGHGRRIYATMKFVLYTMAGSLLMLVAIIVTCIKAGAGSFDYADLLAGTYAGSLGRWLFLAYALAFAFKVPLFPFHTWLPDAHVEAPTAGSVILAGVLLKMGTYGFLRFAAPLYPDAAVYFAPYIAGLAVIGIIYGALLSFAQTDLKKLVAYSSVSHLGFVVLGIFSFTAEGISGATIQMVNHGISTGLLFLLVGMLYERRHTRSLSEMGGLFKIMPLFGTVFIVTALSSAALPGTNGFIGEFLILLGSFRSYRWLAILATMGVILSACYLLQMVQKTLFGPVTKEANKTLPDLSLREKLILAPALVMVFWIGLYPQTFLKPMAPAVTDYVGKMSHYQIPKARRTANLTPRQEPHPGKRAAVTDDGGSR